MQVKLFRYAGVYLLVAAGLMVLSVALNIVAGFELPPGLSTVVPPMLAAMYEGQRYARRTGESLPKGAAWRAAWAMTGIVALISAAILAALLVVPGVWESLNFISPLVLLAITAVLMLVVLLVNRVFLSFGARNELKAAKRRAAKNGG